MVERERKRKREGVERQEGVGTNREIERGEEREICVVIASRARSSRSEGRNYICWSQDEE